MTENKELPKASLSSSPNAAASGKPTDGDIARIIFANNLSGNGITIARHFHNLGRKQGREETNLTKEEIEYIFAALDVENDFTEDSILTMKITEKLWAAIRRGE